MKSLFALSIAILIFTAASLNGQNIYDFIVKDISGAEFDLASLKGKKVMIVNTASKCGFTPQYEDLQALYAEFKDENFVIIGFPANNFMKQEPGSNTEIKEFCKINYGVTFPMMSKISVKGDDIHPLYAYLTKTTDTHVKWNFQKYLINENGSIESVIYSKEKPNSERIVAWIKTGDLASK